MELSVLVVSYNTRELTLACLHSLLAETRDVELEVLVVDNASRDGSAQAIRAALPDVVVLEPGDNLGFARANNLAAERARGEHLLLLNPDTLVLDGAVSKLLAFARANPTAGIWGGRTLRGDGTLDPCSYWGQPSLWSTFCRAAGLTAAFRGIQLFNPEEIGRFTRTRERAVDIVSGCFFLIRRAVWDELDGFDPSFFLYGEETDLCLRARRRGYAPRVTQEATIVHYGGASQQRQAERQMRLHGARVNLMRRHWRRSAARLGTAIALAGIALRAACYTVAARLGRARAEDAAAWREVWLRRSHWLAP